jgi:lipopolysaccharide biosynthesis glycosyltransferase
MQSAADMVGMLTPSQRIVFLDADQVVLKNIDDLFDIEIPQGWIAAVQDCRCEHNRLNPPIEVERGVCPYVAHDQDGPTFKLRFQSSRLQHCLQAGLLVIDPATELLDMLLLTLNTDPIVKDFRAPEQDLLVHCFRFKWKSLSYRYHCIKTLQDHHPDLVKPQEVKMVHFIYHKPWESRVSDQERWQHWQNRWWAIWADLAKDSRTQALPEEFKPTEIRKVFITETGKL